jgi:hypothetical protein
VPRAFREVADMGVDGVHRDGWLAGGLRPREVRRRIPQHLELTWQLHGAEADARHGYRPRWALWVSGTGRLWASRRDTLTATDIAAGCVAFLHADSSGALAGQLRVQEALTGGPSPDWS